MPPHFVKNDHIINANAVLFCFTVSVVVSRLSMSSSCRHGREEQSGQEGEREMMREVRTSTIISQSNLCD